jgi:hypothetical protein
MDSFSVSPPSRALPTSFSNAAQKQHELEEVPLALIIMPSSVPFFFREVSGIPVS